MTPPLSLPETSPLLGWRAEKEGSLVSGDTVSSPDAALLGVTRSLGGRAWRLRATDERLARMLVQRHALPEPVARILAGRGIGPDQADDHLNPSLRTGLPDPSRLRDMDRAAARLAEAVTAGETIAIFADYDVDGATAAALLLRYLRAVGAPTRLYVPDRRTEGYGPNAEALLRLKAEGAALVVLVDCGTTSFGPLDAAAAAGLDAIVLDHHAPEARLPAALAVVNPNRLDDDSGLGTLAACGVTFLALVALSRALRGAGYFGAGREEPGLLALLDLVALGTVCDVVPLTGVNRVLVAQGLKVLARRANPGLRALADVARVAERVDAYHAAFLLGPRINAGGRLGRCDLGARLLAAEDAAEAAELAALLDTHNEDRKAVEAAVLREAIAQIEAEPALPPALVVAGQGWHPGVVGIVAGRLRERYHRPACVVALPALAGTGEAGRGSGRSVPEIDLGAAMVAARQAGLLSAGGGHRMAAGFTVAAERVAEFAAFLAAHVGATVAEPPVPVLELDGALAIGGATPALAEALARLGPFGAGNPEPRFVLPSARVAQASVVGTGHVSCFLAGPDGGRLRGIAFRALDTALGQALLGAGGAPLHLAGTLRLDRWNGRDRVEFRIEDAASTWGGADPGTPH